MKAGLKNRQKLLLVSIICIFLLGGFFMLMNMTLGKSIGKLKADNKKLKEEYDTLQVYVLNKDTYIAETELNTDKINKIAETYEGTITKVSILNKFENIYSDYELQANSLTMQDNQLIDTIETTRLSDDEEIDISYYKLPVSISYNIKYSKLKNFISDILSLDTKMSIKSLSITHDTATGNVTGTLTLDCASMGGFKEYEAPKYNGLIGVDALFSDEATIEDYVRENFSYREDNEDDVEDENETENEESETE